MNKRILFYMISVLMVLVYIKGPKLIKSDEIVKLENRKKIEAIQERQKTISNTNIKKEKVHFVNVLKLPEELQGKVLFSDNDKIELKKHYTDPIKIEFAINHLLDVSKKAAGEEGIARIDSIDFLEKSIRYRDNKMRPKIIQFIEDFTHYSPSSDMSKQNRKFILGDQIELLEVLAFNQPREFLYLKQRTTNEKVLKMMKLVEHHANRNQ